jgi:hypothetical protein
MPFTSTCLARLTLSDRALSLRCILRRDFNAVKLQQVAKIFTSWDDRLFNGNIIEQGVNLNNLKQVIALWVAKFGAAIDFARGQVVISALRVPWIVEATELQQVLVCQGVKEAERSARSCLFCVS